MRRIYLRDAIKRKLPDWWVEKFRRLTPVEWTGRVSPKVCGVWAFPENRRPRRGERGYIVGDVSDKSLRRCGFRRLGRHK